MSKEEILQTIKKLSQSQGYYCRLLQSMNDELLEFLEDQNFSDQIDLVLFLES